MAGLPGGKQLVGWGGEVVPKQNRSTEQEKSSGDADDAWFNALNDHAFSPEWGGENDSDAYDDLASASPTEAQKGGKARQKPVTRP
jgi:hypothetical protein